VLAEVGRPLDELAPRTEDAATQLQAPPPREAIPIRDRRGGGIAGTIAALVACGEPVLVVAADALARARHLAPILGGFELCSHAALERDPALARPGAHVVLLDPPAGPVRAYGALTHLAWGPPELEFAAQVHDRQYDLRAALATTYRSLRDAGGAAGEELEALLRGDVQAPRPAQLAGRLVRVLVELDLVILGSDGRSLSVPEAERTELERSAAYRAYHQRYEDGRRWLSAQRARAA
jgi:single-stranded-DNA-specific exonuclease